MLFCQLYFDKVGKKAIIAHRRTNHMAEFEVLEGKRRPSVRETVILHLRRLRGVDIFDEVLFRVEDGATERGTVYSHARDILDSPDGTVSIGGNGYIRRVPIKSIRRVIVRMEKKISRMSPVAGGEIDVDFYANALGVREGIGAALSGRQEASGERVPTYGHGEIVGGAGGRKRRVADGQISGQDGNVVYAQFGGRNVK